MSKAVGFDVFGTRVVLGTAALTASTATTAWALAVAGAASWLGHPLRPLALALLGLLPVLDAVVHELSHALAAASVGGRVKLIRIGVLTHMRAEGVGPDRIVRVALAGPASSTGLLAATAFSIATSPTPLVGLVALFPVLLFVFVGVAESLLGQQGDLAVARRVRRQG
jgi:hypothetical protein